MKSDNQKDLVLEHLKERGSITPLVALREYGIFRLACCVFDLRKEGYPVVTERVEVRKANGKIARVANYLLDAKGA